MKRLILLLCILALLISGCSSVKPSEEPPEDSGLLSEEVEIRPVELAPAEKTADPGALPVKEMTMAIPKPPSLLPWVVRDQYQKDLLSLIYEPLWVLGDDGRLVFILADEVDLSDDGSYVDISLKEGVWFHDGSGLDAGDVYYSIRKLQAGSSTYAASLDMIEDMTVVDYYTIRLYLEKGGYQALERFVFPVVPEDFTDTQIPVGTGPYICRERTNRREMVLEAYEDYHGKAPSLGRIRVLFVESDQAVEEAFGSGRTDIFHRKDLSWKDFQFRNDLSVTSFDSSELLYLEFSTAGFGSVLSNRQKVAWALDNEGILRETALSYGTVTETPFRPDYWYGTGIPEGYGYDPERAKMVAISGDENAYIRLMYDASDPAVSRAASSIWGYLSEAGIKVSLVTFGAYDMRLVRKSVCAYDAAKILGQAERLEGLSADELPGAVRELASEALEELPVYGLFFLNDGVVIRSNLAGDLMPAEGHVFGGIENIR